MFKQTRKLEGPISKNKARLVAKGVHGPLEEEVYVQQSHGFSETRRKVKYEGSAAKENNSDEAWGVAGEPRHVGVHHNSRPQHSFNNAGRRKGVQFNVSPYA